MTSDRLKTLAVGGSLALVVGLLITQGAFLGADLPRNALFGVAAGAIVALVPDRSALARAVSFILGAFIAWFGYALRAAVLPDIALGRAIAAALVILGITALAAGTNGRLPLWSGLLGTVALLGAYEASFVAHPVSFLGDSVTALTTLGVSAAVGMLICELLGEAEREPAVEPDPPRESEPRRRRAAVPGPRTAADTEIASGTEATR